MHVGYVAPSLGNYTKVQRFKLPRKLLRKGEVNEIVFDHADNPANQVAWAIGKVRLNIRPLPACSGDECVREAKKAYDLAMELLEKKGIAAENTFLAWKALHTCLLFLENLENNKPSLYTLAQSTLRDTDREARPALRQDPDDGQALGGAQGPEEGALRVQERPRLVPRERRRAPLPRQARGQDRRLR
ncbi:MAG: hypothetical protein QM765_29530 [Myxococcales bacterium]